MEVPHGKSLAYKRSRDRKGVPHGPDGPPNRMKVSGTHFSELSRDRKGADVPGTAAIRSLTVAASMSLAALSTKMFCGR